MQEKKVIEIFEKAGGLLTGHFLLTSGKHSEKYLEKFAVLQQPEYTELLCKEIADHFKKYNIDVVVGAAIGGIILSYETARQLKVRGIFMEREEGKLKLRRGFTINEGEKVLIVEDIVTTGGSVQEIINELKQNYKCEIAGVGLLIDRSGKNIDFGCGETFALAKMNIETFEPKNCPLCKKNIPITKRGSKDLKNL
jgi:orotate phosphoribosyltransferase